MVPSGSPLGRVLPKAGPNSRLLRFATGRVIRLSGSTRAGLVLVGCTVMGLSWFLPWYSVLYWLKDQQGFHTAMGSNHYSTTEVIGPEAAAHGNNFVVERDYSGSTLVTSARQLRELALSEQYYKYILILGVVALVAVWAHGEKRRDNRFFRAVARIADISEGLGVIAAVAYVVDKTANLTSLHTVESAATAQLVQDLGSQGGGSSAIAFVSAGFSTGFIAVTVGLVIAGFGVLAGERSDDEGDSRGPSSRAAVAWFAVGRLLANLLLLVGLVYIAASLLVFI
ncbi:hypothetical protein GCM10009665_05390 [Kitasatospora nipponensis]|uniref:Uncharacterized protein n=1 Tax=Kitasatospora nipponensis TaxID=258049 RepID=A0ABP4GDM5_9ACTN